MNELFIVLLIGHLLSDYTLQTKQLAKNKIKNLSGLSVHIFIVFIVYLLLWLFFRFNWIVLIGVVIGHGLIDLMKYWVSDYLEERISYGIDQILHLLLLCVLSWNSDFISNTFEINRWIALLLLMSKPANVTFKVYFKKYAKMEESESIEGAGALIGTIERIIMLIFVILQQYASMGLILTAKSIARFDKISKDQMFAEYYLLGSLFSVLWVLVSCLLLGYFA